MPRGSDRYSTGSPPERHCTPWYTLGRKPEAYRAAYWKETVQAVGARQVIPIHWDNFWRPLDEPLQAMPLLLDDFGAAMQDLQARAAPGGIQVRMPPLFVPFVAQPAP